MYDLLQSLLVVRWHVHMFVLQAGTKWKKSHIMIYMPITPVMSETSILSLNIPFYYYILF